MTENDAPESTRARIGFLSIITSSWLPVILAVDGGFQYTRPHLLGRSLSLIFLAPTAWRLTGSAIWRRGSVTTYWGSASRGTWRKTARRVWSAYFLLQCQRRRSSVGGFELSKTAFLSLGSSALHVRTSAVETNRIGDRVEFCVWLTSRWTSSRTIVRIERPNQSLSVRDATGTTFGSLSNLGRPTLLLHIFDMSCTI
ncbi:hypothetical protein TNCV_3178691 [Trichonephila clavipes]|uniref:Uncharacterized protein n=1 Tax=Trichonephila clavipes TaxID=2585209 RepID=A0A8X6REK0_TRICX|nr:hypothetical protein TNCV_3178691 [Trichonephila clavipes]